MKIQAINHNILLKRRQNITPKLKPLPFDTFSFSGSKRANLSTSEIEKSKVIFKESIEQTADEVVNGEEFLNWANKIDYKKLCKIAPEVINFDYKLFKEFLSYHFKIGTEDFTTKNLTYSNFEEFLGQDLIDSFKLTEILTRFPATKRIIGDFPKDWGADKSSLEEVSNAISEFRAANNIRIKTNYKPSNFAQLIKKLENITKKPTTIEYLKEGCYGQTFKITVKDASPVILKLFKATPKTTNNLNCQQGAGAEPQIGYFSKANNLSNYAQFHFGQVANENNFDAFYIADFIDDKSKFKKETKMDKLGLNLLSTKDDHCTNIISGKIVDYGASYFIVEPKIYKIAKEIIDNTYRPYFFRRNTKVTEFLSKKYKNIDANKTADFIRAVNYIVECTNPSFSEPFKQWILSQQN